MINHSDCRCAACRDGWEKTIRWQDEMLEKHGWYIHALTDDVDFHTHGVAESFGHLDFQIVQALPGDAVQGIFNRLVRAVRSGRKYLPGDETIFLSGERLSFSLAEESKREVLRVHVSTGDKD